MRLVWSNAKLFNLEGSDLWMAADRLSREFEALFCEWVINPPDGYGCVCVVVSVSRFYCVFVCLLFLITIERTT